MMVFFISGFVLLMLDINDVRARKDELQKVCEYKGKDINLDDLLALDDQRKQLQQEVDELKHKQKLAGEQKDFETAKSLKAEIQALQDKYNEVYEQFTALLWEVPNFVHDTVPRGKSEDENVVIKKVGEPPVFDFEPKDNQALGEALGMMDKEQAAQVSGSRFFYLTGDLAQLQYALINFVFSVMTSEETLQKIIDDAGLSVTAKPFTLVIPPTIVSQKTMDRMGRLHPKDERYCLEKDNQVLVGSAEHSLGPIHMDQVLEENQLPLRYLAYTSSYRREAGTYGKDTRGIFRTHEFHKIEMESFCMPETGIEEQDLLVAIQEYLVAQLGLAYQVLNKCTADVGSMDYRAFDVEVWMPGQDKYRETHTADYMTDYQARRLNIKLKRNDGKKGFVHMQDATAFAIGRIIIAIMENYQQKDGTIKVPEVLVPFMGGKTVIK